VCSGILGSCRARGAGLGWPDDRRSRYAISSQRRANAGTSRSRSLRLLSDEPRTLARNPAVLRAAITKTVTIETTINITPSSNDGSRRCGWPRPRRSVHKVRIIQRSASARLYGSHATTATNRTPDIRDRRSRRGARHEQGAGTRDSHGVTRRGTRRRRRPPGGSAAEPPRRRSARRGGRGRR
jgi:hypothetical protein